MPAGARRALLERLIDHAPLFPPAALPMQAALAEDRRFRAGPDGWLVRRFVCPASKLPELDGLDGSVSVVLDGEHPIDDPRVEAVEAGLGADVRGLAALATEVYLEVAPGGDLEPLAAHGLRAKVRCGGARVPTVEELAGFVRRCRELGVPFKATAGLHHAVRTGAEHGFLNLLAAAQFGEEEQALAETDPDAFALEEEGFSWRGRLAGAEEIARMRAGLFVGFGSCSAQEPADELRALGFLPA
ncbi:MAG: hypothetical protein ABR521_05950 [Gaiellaceae bacterium]